MRTSASFSLIVVQIAPAQLFPLQLARVANYLHICAISMRLVYQNSARTNLPFGMRSSALSSSMASSVVSEKMRPLQRAVRILDRLGEQITDLTKAFETIEMVLLFSSCLTSSLTFAADGRVRYLKLCAHQLGACE